MVAYTLHMLKLNIIAAVVIIIVMFLARLTKDKYSSKWKYYMWLAVSVFLLLPVHFPSGGFLNVQIQKPEAYRPAAEKVQENVLNSGDIQAVPSVPDGSNPVTPVKMHNPVSVEVSSSAVSVYGLLELFSVIWVVGVVLLAVSRALRYHFSVHAMKRWSYPVDDKRVQELYRYTCVKLHVGKPPRLFISSKLSSPILAGLRSTGLYLTEEEYDLEELKFIFSHELSHYRRKDLWYKMLLMVVTTIYWFNPALHWMQSEAENTIENLCDGSVVKEYSMDEKMRYGRLLLKTAAFQNHVPYLAASLNDSTLVFKERILYMRNLGFLKEKYFPVAVLVVVMIASQVLIGSSVKSVPANGTAPVTSLSPEEFGDQLLAAAGMTAGSPERSGTPDLASSSQAEDNFSNVRFADVSASVQGAADGQSGAASAAERGAQTPDSPENAAGTVQNVDAYTVEDSDYSAWVTSQQLSIQSSYSADSSVVGTLYYGDVANVTGIVNVNGQDSGWSRIESNGLVGYVPSQYVSQNGVSVRNKGITLTEERITLYTTDDTGASYVYKATDGNWYDYSGRNYVPDDASGLWTLEPNGTTWTETPPESPADHAIDQVQTTDAGKMNYNTLYLNEEGIWQNIARGLYVSNGDDTWTGPDGTIWYLVE